MSKPILGVGVSKLDLSISLLIDKKYYQTKLIIINKVLGPYFSGFKNMGLPKYLHVWKLQAIMASHLRIFCIEIIMR
jgi:hypothetical protein